MRRSWRDDRWMQSQSSGWKIAWLIRYWHSFKSNLSDLSTLLPKLSLFQSFSKILSNLISPKNTPTHFSWHSSRFCNASSDFSICACAVSSVQHDSRAMQTKLSSDTQRAFFRRALSQTITRQALVDVTSKRQALKSWPNVKLRNAPGSTSMNQQ